MAKEYQLEILGMDSVLFQVDGVEVLSAIIMSGACEKFPNFRFVLGESGVTWLPYILNRFDEQYEDRLRDLNFSMKTQRLLPPQRHDHLSAGILH